MKYEPLIYYDEPDHKVVDLRPEGVPFVPLASRAVRRCTQTQLARDLGFSSASHFVRAFKQVTGSTFSQWQKSIPTKE